MRFNWLKHPQGFHMLPAHLIQSKPLTPPRRDLTVRVNLDLFVSQEMSEKLFQLIDADTLQANGR